jgi:hypothetical protein
MMRDAQGSTLKIGDRVMIPCRIVGLRPDLERYNLEMETTLLEAGRSSVKLVLNSENVILDPPIRDSKFVIHIDSSEFKNLTMDIIAEEVMKRVPQILKNHGI